MVVGAVRCEGRGSAVVMVKRKGTEESERIMLVLAGGRGGGARPHAEQ